MAESAQTRNARLVLARSLVSHLEQGNEDEAGSVIAELAGFTESQLFQEVGRLTRELHDSLNDFVRDSGLIDLTETEIPNAAERLRFVITTTERAANTTLGAVEDGLPLADALRSDAHHLSEEWQRFNSRQLSVDDFRALSSELSQFLEATQANSKELHDKLSEVLMAQSYQDITGQIIKKVIDLVDDVEQKLVELVRLSGVHVSLQQAPAAAVRAASAGHGPVVPGIDNGDVVANQDEVDDLLSSLGF